MSAAGPSQGAKAPSGGSEPHAVGERGGVVMSAAGPSQGAKAPSGGSEPHAVGERGGVVIQNRRWRRVAEMAQQVAAEPGPHVASPCQSVCIMHPTTGWCEGCLRTIAEIADWSRLDKPAKLAVWAQLPERLTQRIALEDAP